MCNFGTLGQRKGGEQSKLKVLRKSFCLLTEFRSAGKVIYLYRDYQHLIVTRKKGFFYKVFYKVCFMGCMALLPASYTEDNKICLDLNGGKSENNI